MNTYFFDFDGTLADSMPSYVKALRRIMERNGLRCSDGTIKVTTTLGFEKLSEYLKNKCGICYAKEKLLQEFDEVLHLEYENNVTLKEGALAYIKLLKDGGNSVNILSAGQPRYILTVLRRYGIVDLFDHYLYCDSLGLTKSDPQIYLSAAERVNAKLEDCCFFDDNIEAIQAAAKAGIYTIGVYDKTSEPYEDDIKAIANRYIHHWNELV